MSIEDIALRLVELCREEHFSQAQTELYAEDALSIEPEGLPPGSLGTVKGLQAIKDKGRQFQDRIKLVHSITVSEPIIADNLFSVAMNLDVTFKQQGRRMMSEICLYRVHEGKIVQEQFFYDVG
ncbi:MAG: SnoaL-like domain-containing protein [Rudaea sp.]